MTTRKTTLCGTALCAALSCAAAPVEPQGRVTFTYDGKDFSCSRPVKVAEKRGFSMFFYKRTGR